MKKRYKMSITRPAWIKETYEFSDFPMEEYNLKNIKKDVLYRQKFFEKVFENDCDYMESEISCYMDTTNSVSADIHEGEYGELFLDNIEELDKYVIDHEGRLSERHPSKIEGWWREVPLNFYNILDTEDSCMDFLLCFDRDHASFCELEDMYDCERGTPEFLQIMQDDVRSFLSPEHDWFTEVIEDSKSSWNSAQDIIDDYMGIKKEEEV